MRRRSAHTTFLTPWRRSADKPSPRHAKRGSRRTKGLALLVAIALPITISELLPVTASASGPDTIQFTQTSGSSKAYFKYVPGDGSTVTTQNVTGGGGCSSPTIGKAITGTKQGTTDPLLGWAAGDWASQADYTGTRTAAIVGAYNGETGVCAEAANFSIDNVVQPLSGNSHWGLEALDFKAGTNSIVAGRGFSRATINIANNTAKATTVHLFETLNGATVGDQTCPVGATTKSNSPAIVGADTKPGATNPCTVNQDPTFTGFDNIEIQVPNAGESVSVVQTSTFYLSGGKVCAGTPVSTTDQSASGNTVTATITLNGPTGDCKSFSNFAVDADTQQMIFSGSGTLQNGDYLTGTFDWGERAFCTPEGEGSTPVCTPTQVTFDGQHYTDQRYCKTAPYDADTPWCTTGKSFTYDQVGSTHITETWAGVGDPAWKNS